MSTAEEYNVYGIQLGQLFDENKLDVLNISSPILNLNKDVDYIINKGGDWRCLLLNSNVSLFTIYGKFLKIRVKSKFNGMLNEALSSKHFPIPYLLLVPILSCPLLNWKKETSRQHQIQRPI